MQCIDQSLKYSEFMEDTYQLTVEQVKHNSQILFSQYSLFSLTSYVFWAFREAVVGEYWIYSGNSVQIFGPFFVGKFMHHSWMYGCKFVRCSYRI
jgi:hypothetical protein